MRGRKHPIVATGSSCPMDRDQGRTTVVELKNRALALLENSRFEEADRAFVDLSRQVPNDALPRRNLAICRLLSLDRQEASARLAKEALEAMLARERDSAPAFLVAARILLHPALSKGPDAKANKQRGLQLLELAMTRNPADPVFSYALFKTGEFQAGGVPEKAAAALRKSCAQAPDNLHLALKLFSVQSDAKDPAVRVTIESLQRRFAQIRPERSSGGADVMRLLDDGLTALKSRNWDDVQYSALALGNISKSDSAVQGDAASVDPHPLAFILWEFADPRIRFTPVSEPAALSVTFRARPPLPGSGEVLATAFVDFDLDGAPDLLALRPGGLEVFSRQRSNGTWRSRFRTDIPAGLTGLLTADFDRDAHSASPQIAATTTATAPSPVGTTTSETVCQDADPDVVLWGKAGVVVLKNDLDPASRARTLRPVGTSGPLAKLRDVWAACLADIDHDGDLDLVVSTNQGVTFWSNRGDMTFEDVSARSDLPPKSERFLSMVPVDIDRDADIDLVLAGPASIGYLENLRHQRFRWRPFLADHQAIGPSSCLALLDLNGNGSWDFVSTGASGVSVLRTLGLPGEIRTAGVVTVSRAPEDGVRTFDFDNDGHLDLLSWSRRGLAVFRGTQVREFEQIAGPETEPVGIRDVQTVDWDGDGDTDLLVATEKGIVPIENQGGNANRWLDLRLIGRADNRDRVNSYGIGSLIEIKTPHRYQARVVQSPSTHFGLGPQPGTVIARILWTSGVSQSIIDPKPDQSLCEPMELKGSCPFAYTWNGERFEFFTDLLWAAPLGLRAPDGSVVPPRSWEYLKIPGARLSPRDGIYRVKVTEELWEAGYFDQVELLAVDHPADVEIYSNEKVGPAEIARFGIHTVRRPRTPISVRDAKGHDLLPLVRDRDDRYARPFDHRIRRGWTEPHFLELDLGDVGSPNTLKLFLTGWVFPSDSSLNVACSQKRGSGGPRWPSIWIPERSGAWKEAVAYMGFPGGKTKTVVIDVSRVFNARDHRIRIVSSAEIYWDQIFFTTDEAPAETHQITLPLRSAELRHRGFSVRKEGPQDGPETFLYEQVEREPIWPPMTGLFTRYGDVRSLLEKPDDKLVVMGAGDEISLEFDSVPPPRAGWRRDFLLHSVGWDKDADVNTIAGQSSEPLPFRAMKSYPPASHDRSPADDRFRGYLAEYQTRRQCPVWFWRKLAHPDPEVTGQRLRSVSPLGPAAW